MPRTLFLCQHKHYYAARGLHNRICLREFDDLQHIVLINKPRKRRLTQDGCIRHGSPNPPWLHDSLGSTSWLPSADLELRKTLYINTTIICTHQSHQHSSHINPLFLHVHSAPINTTITSLTHHDTSHQCVQ